MTSLEWYTLRSSSTSDATSGTTSPAACNREGGREG